MDSGLILSAALLGLGSGLSPGPLSTLAISQTLRHGAREGVKVCFAPLLTDLPVIGLSIFLLSQVADLKPALAALSLAGAFFIFHLAYVNLTFKPETVERSGDAVKPSSFRMGLVTSLLSPYAFLFWTGVGSPYLVKAWNAGPLSVLAFIVAFYGGVMLAKSGIVALAANARPFLGGRGYGYCIRALGVVIAVFGFKFLMDGARGIQGVI